jgi:hypothetical protein
LLGEFALGVEQDDLRFRLLRLQIMGDHADPLVGAGRAAERVGRRGKHHKAAIVHRAELLDQHLGLPARAEIGMRHHFGSFGRIALDGVIFQRDAGREHELVIGDAVAPLEPDLALRAVYIARRGHDEAHTQFFQAVIIMHERFEAQQAANMQVGEKAGPIDRLRFDERDLKLRRAFLDIMRHRRAARAAADNDHPALALRESRAGAEPAGKHSSY